MMIGDIQNLNKENLSVQQALNIFLDNNISTKEIYDAACNRINEMREGGCEVFVPLYISNYCDSNCKICGMRKDNDLLIRKNIGRTKILEQLEIIYFNEKVSALGILTGEYSDNNLRELNLFKIGWTINEAFKIGFKRIYLNIGSLSKSEIDYLKDWIGVDQRVILCVFQEFLA